MAKFLQKIRDKMEKKGTVGAFHKETGTPAGKPIPASKTNAVLAKGKAESEGDKKMTPDELKSFRRAQFAKNAREGKFGHK